MMTPGQRGQLARQKRQARRRRNGQAPTHSAAMHANHWRRAMQCGQCPGLGATMDEPCTLIDWTEHCCTGETSRHNIYRRLVRHGGHRNPACPWNKEV